MTTYDADELKEMLYSKFPHRFKTVEMDVEDEAGEFQKETVELFEIEEGSGEFDLFDPDSISEADAAAATAPTENS